MREFLSVIFYFFFFQALVLAAFGTLGGDATMMCTGWVGSAVCLSIALRNRQNMSEGTVQPLGVHVPETSPHHALAGAMWTGGAAPLDRYQSVMARLRLAPSTSQTAASLVKQHKRWFNGGEQAAQAFFNHPQVVKALDLGGANPTPKPQAKAPSSTQKPGKVTADLRKDSFWGNLEQTAAESVPAADGVCGMANCSNDVNAFSFQCFQCRRRVCSSCGNSGVLCITCAS
jgi:hypothetical protein